MGKIAIVLNGGVDRGAYHAGALDALFRFLPQRKNEFIVVGTSIGALNGVILADGLAANSVQKKTQELMNLWKNEVTPSKVFGTSKAVFLKCLLRITQVYKRHPLALYADIVLLLLLNAALLMFFANRTLFPFLFRVILIAFFLGEVITALIAGVGFSSLYMKGYLLNSKHLRRLLEKHVHSNSKRKINLVITATHLQGMLREHHLAYETSFRFNKINKPAMIDAALASSAIPIAFPSMNIGKNTYVDGGVKNNTPLNYAIEAGADTIILITHQPREKPSRKLTFGPFEKLSRIGEILLYDSIENDLRRARRINLWLKKLKNFSNERAVKQSLNLKNKRCISIIEIRPSHELGSWFEALYNRDKLNSYIQQGYQDTLKKKQEIMKALYSR